jgi:hypothetical protein
MVYIFLLTLKRLQKRKLVEYNSEAIQKFTVFLTFLIGNILGIALEMILIMIENIGGMIEFWPNRC